MFLRRFFTSCLLLSLSFSLMANKDSLWGVWLDESIADTIRLKANLNLIKEYYLYQDLDSTLFLAEELNQLAVDIDSKYWESTASGIKGFVYDYKGEKEKAIQFYQESANLCYEYGDSLEAAFKQINIGAIFQQYGELDTSIVLFESALHFGELVDDSHLISAALFALSTSYHYKDDYPKALSLYQACAEILENNDFDKSQSNEPYSNMGSIYRELNQLELAENYYQKSLEFNKIYAKNQEGHIVAIIGIGDIHFDKGLIEVAKKYYKIGIEMAEKSKDYQIYLLTPLATISEILLGENDPKAIELINRLIRIAKKKQDIFLEINGYNLKGNYNLNQGKLSKAHFWCKKSYDSSKEVGDIALQKESCDCLYQVNKKLNKPQKALFFHEQSSILYDSILGESKIRELTQVEMQFQFDKQQLQDSLTNQQQLLLIEKDKAVLTAQNRNYLIASFGIGLLALTILGFYLNVRSKNQQITQQKIDLEQLNTTKDRLFTIISHDLRKPALAFRGISKKVKFLIQQEEFETLDKYGASLEKAAYSLNGLLDNLLNWALQQRNVLPYNPAPINVAEVTQEIYDLFHQMAADKNIHLKMNIPESTTIFADLNAYSTIVRNLIDNAIKYTPEGGTIDLSAKKVAEKIVIKVADTGTGISAKKIKQLFDLQQNKSSQGTAGEMGSGLGLTLVKDLLELNKGTIKVESEVSKGSTFEVLLPAA